MEQIEHVILILLENRSFDNLLGWLYADTNNHPSHNIPAEAEPRYDGLVADTYYNTREDDEAPRVYVKKSTSGWPPNDEPLVVPLPDPGEVFEHITRQIFGTTHPEPNAKANMSGFLRDYATIAEPAVIEQIMECYSPEQVPVINALARNFAVCDRWFAAVPCQTWPNRGFVHCGSSAGHINNGDYIPYDMTTIFNVLNEQGISWGVFADTIYTPALTQLQFSSFGRSRTISKHFLIFKSFVERQPTQPQAKNCPPIALSSPGLCSSGP